MASRSVPGQINLFNIEDYSDSNVACGMSCGLTIASTCTKVSPHQKITRKVLDAVAIKLTSLEPLNSPQLNQSKD